MSPNDPAVAASTEKPKQTRKKGQRKPPGLLLSIPGTSRALGEGFSPKTVRTLIAKGFLPARQLGGKTVILRRELEQFVDRLPAISSVEGALARGATHDRAAGRS
jgi:hypothetical protein